MPSVPLFIILIVIFFKKYPFLIILLALLNLPFLSQSLNSFDVQGHTQAVSRFISTTAYRELYRSLLPTSSLVEESEFIKVNEYLFQTLSIRTIDVKIENIKQSDNDASADYTISYITKYGPISNTSNLKFTRFHNQWKLVWDWNYLLPNFLPTSQFDIKTSPITLKNLLDVNQKIIATRSPWKSVYAIPQAMYHWTEDVDDLAKLTGQSPNEIDKTIKKFVPDNYPRFVGYVNPTIGLEKGSQLVKSMGGVSLADVEYLNITAQNYPNVPYLSAYIHGLYINNPQYLYIPCQISLINNDKKTIITTFSISDKNLQLTVPPPSRQD